MLTRTEQRLYDRLARKIHRLRANRVEQSQYMALRRKEGMSRA